MADFDLDAIGEEVHDEWTVQAKGRTFRFPGSLSINTLRGFAGDVDKMMKYVDGKAPTELGEVLDVIEQVLKPLAGPDQTAEMLEHVDIRDIQRIIVWLFGKYGLGEASASSTSSETDGASSTSTSNGSSDSTSTASSTGQDTDTPAASSA